MQTHALRTLLIRLAAVMLVATSAGAETVSRLSSRFLVRGEQALLEIGVSGSQPSAFPDIPRAPGLEIQPSGRGAQTRLLPGRRLEYVFEFLVSSYDIGSHTVPPFEVMVGGFKRFTEPIEFTVFDPDDLVWSDAVAGNTRFRYASAFRVLNPRPYDGESTPVEIKIFVPNDLLVEDWGIPDFERDGLTAWRFQPSAMRGSVNLLGSPYRSVAYPSTLTPTRTGSISIGPATLRLMTTEFVMDGIPRRVAREVNLTIPKLEIDAQPLPPGAPEGFENAVGSFKLAVSSSLTEVQEGDPIPVEIIVSGSGNLDALRPPSPVETTGWKLYDATTEQRGDERRELSGTTVFHQFMRPLELKSSLPSFRLVYFEPKTKTYQTVTSDPIPLIMTPAPSARTGEALAPPQALSTPVERMTDILGILQPAQLTMAGNRSIPDWVGHAVGGLLALALITKALWMRNRHRFRKDPVKSERLADLRRIEQARGIPDSGFLMAAGQFIERWLGESPAPELREILAERDAACFRAEKPTDSILQPKRRNAILKALRKSVTLSLFLVLGGLGTQQGHAQSIPDKALSAYDSANYAEAIGIWLSAGPYGRLSPDVLYNIGNACYRAGSPGHAALYYRRALSRDPSHQESRQNLRFIERKYGSLTVHRPEYQDALTRFPLATWQSLLWTGVWLCLLAVLVFPATRSGARLRVAAVVALVMGPLLAASGGLGWRYYPSDAEFTSLDRQAVIIAENAVLHVDASRTSPEVIDAPPGSLCEVIQQSGRWSYVAFATKTRGWIPTEAIEKVVPDSTPRVPKIRKPKADEKSA